MVGVEFRQAVETGLELGVGMRPAPSLVAYAALLALPAADVEELVERELEQNPALERVEPERCGRCGSIVLASGCPACRSFRGSTAPEAVRAVPLDAIEQGADPIADLRRDLGTILHRDDLPLADHVLASLDERGFLREGSHGIAARLGIDAARVAHVVAAIRAVGPYGICAADARECLTLQLSVRPALVAAHPILTSLVDDHLDALASGSLGAIARRLGTTREAVAAARDALTAELRPCALLDCSRAARPGRRVEPGTGDADIVVAVSEQDDRLLVELVEPLRLGVVISFSYDRLGESGARGGDDAQLAGARVDVERGRAFARKLEQRWRTIRRVAEAAVAHQREFVLRTDGPLRPLTRAEVARVVGMHESTVSRATARRTMLLPDGRLIELSALFDSALGPRETLRRLLAGEGRHLSDRELAEALARHGHPVARRTVAKYRARLGVVAAAQR